VNLKPKGEETMAKRDAIQPKNMVVLEVALNPDFSDDVKDGVFDAVDAFESHINNSKVFLSGAMALLGDSPAGSQALSLLELFEVALSRGIDEAYRVRALGKAA
jgi:hypothetical protein